MAYIGLDIVNQARAVYRRRRLSVFVTADWQKDVLSQQKDNVALIKRVLQREDNLYDAQEAMQNVEAL